MTFALLLATVLLETRLRIANGEVTERALARRVGVSQSQMHNVLKGARTLSPKLADRLLVALEIPLDLSRAMLVIADPTPLNYLILIDTIEVLPGSTGNILPRALGRSCSTPPRLPPLRTGRVRYRSGLNCAMLRPRPNRLSKRSGRHRSRSAKLIRRAQIEVIWFPPPCL